MSENHISNKKPTYPISNHLTDYLRKYSSKRIDAGHDAR